MNVQLDLMEVDLITLLAHVHNGVEQLVLSLYQMYLVDRISRSAESLDRDAKFSGQNIVLLKFCILVNSGQQRFTPQTGTDQLESDIGSMQSAYHAAVT